MKLMKMFGCNIPRSVQLHGPSLLEDEPRFHPALLDVKRLTFETEPNGFHLLLNIQLEHLMFGSIVGDEVCI